MAQYDGGAVSDGGCISGSVKFKGTAPAPKKLDVSKDKEVCAKTAKFDQSLIVNNGNLANAVVMITDIKKGKKSDVKKVTLDQNGCEYKPHVLAFPAGSTVEILNPDGILHNVHSYSKVNSPFNMPNRSSKKPWIRKSIRPKRLRSNAMCMAGWKVGWWPRRIRILP